MDIGKILNVNNSYNTILQQENGKNAEKIDGGLTWNRMTLVLLPESGSEEGKAIGKPFKQTFPITSPATNKLELQLHESGELANFLHNELKPITLEFGYEYFIDVTPSMKISTDEFKLLDIKRRNCILENENNNKSSIFRNYHRSNCRYECYVQSATKQCHCIPWEFILNQTQADECDVFGRTCFYEAMETSKTACAHCWDDCDFLRFKKQISTKRALMMKETRIEPRYIKLLVVFSFSSFNQW